MNRERCGSADIYDEEYICTKQEMVATTKNIVVAKGSIIKDQVTFNNSELIQVPSFKWYTVGVTKVKTKW